MEKLNLSDELAVLASNMAHIESELSTIKRLAEKYPDFSIYSSSSDSEGYIYCSNIAVAADPKWIITPEFTSNRSSVYIWLYQWLDDIVIRSDPPYIKIASANPNGFGLVPTDTWRAEISAITNSKGPIKAVEDRLSREARVDYLEVK